MGGLAEVGGIGVGSAGESQTYEVRSREAATERSGSAARRCGPIAQPCRLPTSFEERHASPQARVDIISRRCGKLTRALKPTGSFD